LPPVDCPLVVLLPSGVTARVERTSFIESKDRMMEYRVEGWPVLLLGRFPWSYP